MEARIERSKEVRSGVRKLSPNKNVQSSNKDFQSTRKEKRRRWAKRSKPVAKIVAPKAPAKEYVCVCHGEVARKPKAGQKEVAKDPESGKMKDTTKGLGHWRCSVTNKGAKVTPRTPELKTKGNTVNLSCPDIIYPAKLQTPTVVSVTNDPEVNFVTSA